MVSEYLIEPGTFLLKLFYFQSQVLRSESFDRIMQEWNQRWEDARSDGITLLDRSETLALSIEESAEGETESSQAESFFKTDYDIMLSATENEYIDSKKNLCVGYLREHAPFQYETEDELLNRSFAGLCAMMCRTIEDNTSLMLEYVPYDSEEELIQALESGELDMAAGVKNIPLYEDRIKFSRDYIEYINVLMRNENIDVNHLEGRRQAVISGENDTIELTDQPQTVEVASIAEAVKSIETQAAEYAITNYYSAEYYIRDGECQNIVVMPLTEKT